MDTILNFEVNANADLTCEQGLKLYDDARSQDYTRFNIWEFHDSEEMSEKQ